VVEIAITVDEFVEQVAAAFQIPLARLLGNVPTSSAVAEIEAGRADIEVYCSRIREIQEDAVRRAMRSRASRGWRRHVRRMKEAARCRR
jgi:hypothetical protein